MPVEFEGFDFELPRALVPTPDGGGIRVKETGTHWIDIYPQIYNYRVTRTPKEHPWWHDRGWCYFGKGQAALLAAILGAWSWDGADDTRPPGWDRDLQTHEYSDRVAFTCPRPGCGMVSHNPNDIREGYCGACHDWTGAEGVARA